MLKILLIIPSSPSQKIPIILILFSYHYPLANPILLNLLIVLISYYRIARKFGGEKVWQIDSFRAFGESKFGELIDQPIDYQL